MFPQKASLPCFSCEAAVSLGSGQLLSKVPFSGHEQGFCRLGVQLQQGPSVKLFKWGVAGDCQGCLWEPLGAICFPLPEAPISRVISHRDLYGLRGSSNCEAPKVKSGSQLAGQLPVQSVDLGPAQRLLVCGLPNTKGPSRVPK